MVLAASANNILGQPGSITGSISMAFANLKALQSVTYVVRVILKINVVATPDVIVVYLQPQQTRLWLSQAPSQAA